MALALCLGLLTACSGGASATSDSLSYEQIKGSGLANLCPQVADSRRDAIAITPNQSYTIRAMCLQPTAFLVKPEPLVKGKETKFVQTKPLTRASYTIDQVSGTLTADKDGRLKMVEQSGFDFQPVTVQLPDGERVPLLFSIKGLVAQSPSEEINPSTNFTGAFDVPAYRTAGFLDPKGRGVSLGYDSAVGLPPQADADEFRKQNQKVFDVAKGDLSLQVKQVDAGTGEISGVFESIQPSDSDFGSREPLDVKIQGVFYARLEPEAT
ncbi:photosystem II manganese-stabilizing polypeptide [Halomicronema hongdechloris]|nr:photosystem II manganese-stabilizing polypeptide [Halomicronema hongdechloris]